MLVVDLACEEAGAAVLKVDVFDGGVFGLGIVIDCPTAIVVRTGVGDLVDVGGAGVVLPPVGSVDAALGSLGRPCLATLGVMAGVDGLEVGDGFDAVLTFAVDGIVCFTPRLTSEACLGAGFMTGVTEAGLGVDDGFGALLRSGTGEIISGGVRLAGGACLIGEGLRLASSIMVASSVAGSGGIGLLNPCSSAMEATLEWFVTSSLSLASEAVEALLGRSFPSRSKALPNSTGGRRSCLGNLAMGEEGRAGRRKVCVVSCGVTLIASEGESTMGAVTTRGREEDEDGRVALLCLRETFLEAEEALRCFFGSGISERL